MYDVQIQVKLISHHRRAYVCTYLSNGTYRVTKAALSPSSLDICRLLQSGYVSSWLFQLTMICEQKRRRGEGRGEEAERRRSREYSLLYSSTPQYPSISRCWTLLYTSYVQYIISNIYRVPFHHIKESRVLYSI